MPFCSRCGVEVDSAVEKCPLCEAPIQKLPMENGSPWPSEELGSSPIPPMSRDERKALARTITTLGFLIPVSIVITVDWFVNRGLSWSLYVLASLTAAWLWALIPLIFNRKPYLLITSITGVAIIAAAVISILAGDSDWLLPIGAPILISAGLLSAGVTAMAMASGRKGGNLAGWILLALAIQSMIIDILVSFWIGGSWRPGWSIIVVSTLIPISALLLYLHFIPSRQRKLRRYFHV